MHSKDKIAHSIHACLQQKANVEIAFDKAEIYTGLADLCNQYVLENKAEQFFEAIEQLNTDYNFGTDPLLDGFIIQIEKMLHPKKAGKVAIQDTPWWETKREQLLSIAAVHSPCYVYDSPIQIAKTKKLQAIKAIDTLFYAIKANPNATILQTLEQQGIGFECVSVQELKRIIELFPNLERKRILFTPNFAPKTEYEFALQLGCHITIDNLYPLENWPELFKNKHIIVRIDPGAGAGHHKHVCTGGNESKFGITQTDLGKVSALSKEHHIHVVGLHSHSGSGILTPELWHQTALMLTMLTTQFPQVQFINLGGGLGVVEKPEQHPLDLKHLDSSLLAIKSQHPHLQFWMEPGRYFVAESGVILAKVTQSKEKGDVKFIGIETGMNSLIRPSLYGAYHEIVNLSRLYEETTQCSHIVGPICESGDTLGYDRLLPETYEGDVLLIANTGAYGYSMSSHYNLRPPAQEIVLD